jgi:carbohydrate diacid regulator
MQSVIDKEFGIIGNDGVIVASSNITKEGLEKEDFPGFENNEEIVMYNGYTYKSISSRKKNEFFVYIEGEDAISQKECKIITISLTNVIQFHNEKFDKNTFIKNIVLDNILPGDIMLKANELHLLVDVNRVVYYIRSLNNNNIYIYDIIENMFPLKNKDFVVTVGDREVILVKELKDEYEHNELEETAELILETLNSELLTNVIIGIGTVVNKINDLARSFKEAHLALEIGKIFDSEKSIISHEKLGIGRLIYQLPTTLCELFLDEIFKKGPIDLLDKETLFTIDKFFENNLNVSETSRKLYVHRNTLVYRLDKIQKITGLDLRSFDHAIVFKVAMMVKKYLDSTSM